MMTIRNLRRAALSALAALTTAATAWSVAPASAAELDRSYVVVNVSTVDANGVVVTDPDGVTGTAMNLTTGQSFTPASVSGTLIWQNLPDGTYRVQVGAGAGWAPVWWPGTYSQNAAGTFVLNKSATDCSPTVIGPNGCYGVKFSTTVPQLRTLTGSVSRRSGARVPNVWVTAALTKEPATRFAVSTDNSGQFFLNVPPGTYELSTPNGNRIARETVEVTAPTVTASLVLLDRPDAPGTVRVSAGSGRATVSWAAPGDDGGSPITDYTAVVEPGGQSCSSLATTCTLTGLTNGTVYTATVTATNAVGTSAISAPSPAFEPRDALPSAPTSVRAIAGAGKATISWQPPREAASVTGYRVTSKPDGLTCTTSNLSCDVTGLTNGTRYTFRVVAVSGGGTGPASAASNKVTPAGVPTAVRNVRVLAGNASLMVQWVRPADNGGARVTGYTVTTFPSGRSCTTDGSARGCAVGGLTNGSPYSVVVTATNRSGTSERSAGSATATPSAGLPRLAAQLRVKPRSAMVTGPVRVRWVASSPAASVVVRWQKSTSTTVKSRTVRISGSVQVPVDAAGRTRVWVQALDSQKRPVAQKSRTYRR